MSKSLGNTIAAAGRHQAERRRHPAPVGGDERLHGGDPRRQGDPDARRRGVPQDPQHDALPARRTSTTSIRPPTRCRTAQLEEVDRYILARYAEVAQRDPDAPTTSTSIGTIFQALNQFATVDLSAFYDDVSKDRLYTFAARSRERRSAQTAMYLMADGLTRLLAPILSFTADELWRFLPGAREESVHIAVFPASAELDAVRTTPSCVDRWKQLDRRARAGARGDRAAAEGQADRQLAAGEGRAVSDACRAGAPRTVRCASCRCCSSCPRSSCGRRRPTSRPTARRGRESRSSGRAA